MRYGSRAPNPNPSAPARATCHIFIAPEWFKKIGEPQDDELELLEETECFREGESRLSCQVKFSDDLDGMTFMIAPEE